MQKNELPNVEYILVPRPEWKRLLKQLERLESPSGGVTWVTIKKFQELTGKTYEQVKYFRKQTLNDGRLDDFFRMRGGRWQVNYKLYNKEYQR